MSDGSPDEAAPFERLDFIYKPTDDAARDVEYFARVLGAQVVFTIEAFETRVAMVRLSAEAPDVLLAEHLEGDRPVLVYRVAGLEAAMAALERRGWGRRAVFGIPHGPCCEFATPGGHRIAIYEPTRPGATERFTGRRDF